MLNLFTPLEYLCVLSSSGYMFPEPGGPMYRRPLPPPGALGPLPPPGALPPGPLHPRGLPPGPPPPTDMAGESLRACHLKFLWILNNLLKWKI